MAKTTGALLSLGAHGSIAKTQVYASWKGRAYARQHVIPANPNTTGQQTTRNTFKNLTALMKLFSSTALAPWQAYVKGKVLTDRNAFIKFNLPVLRGQADNTAFIGSPGANGGITATSIAATDGGSQVADVVLGVPDVPTGWTITDSIALLVPKGDPETLSDYTSYANNSGDDSGSVNVTADTGDWVVTGWFVMTKPDGTIAYGASKVTTVTLA